MDFLYLFIGILIGCVITFLYLKSQKADSDTNQNALLTEKAVLENTIVALKSDIQQSETENHTLREQLNNLKIKEAEFYILSKTQEEKYSTLKSEMENLNKKYSEEFQNIANKILEEKTNKFTEQNKNNLDIILNPLKEKIKDFELKVETAYKTEAAERNSLKGQIDTLMNLNKQISEEANNLAKALKGDNKSQGNWGEIILEKVLESSGLKRDTEYKMQYSVTSDDGKKQIPDVVVFLPDNRHLIIDSKVSLIDYERFVNANTDEDRETAIKGHIASVKNHIKQLSDKAYQSLNNFNSPDFVMLFMPIESSFGIAVKADNDLFSYAWERKIVIVSPSTLLATLRTIETLWKNDRQMKNHLEIAKTGADLYDKFSGFIKDMIDLGQKLESGQKSYKEAMNKLVEGRGNVVKQVEKLKELGVKANKDLPQQLIDRANDTQ